MPSGWREYLNKIGKENSNKSKNSLKIFLAAILCVLTAGMLAACSPQQTESSAASVQPEPSGTSVSTTGDNTVSPTETDAQASESTDMLVGCIFLCPGNG